MKLAITLIGYLTLLGALSTALTLPKFSDQLVFVKQKLDHATVYPGDFGTQEAEWPDVTKWFYHGLVEIEDVMRGLVNGSDTRLPEGLTSEHLSKILLEAHDTFEDFRHEHPTEYEVIKEIAITVAIMVFAPEAFVLIINLIGFGKYGPIFRSLVSTIQAGYGGKVPKGSVFAWLTSAAMGGYAKRHVVLTFRYWTLLWEMGWRLLAHLKGN